MRNESQSPKSKVSTPRSPRRRRTERRHRNHDSGLEIMSRWRAWFHPRPIFVCGPRVKSQAETWKQPQRRRDAEGEEAEEMVVGRWQLDRRRAILECGGRAERRRRFRSRPWRQTDPHHRSGTKNEPPLRLRVSAPLRSLHLVPRSALTKAAWRSASRRTPHGTDPGSRFKSRSAHEPWHTRRLRFSLPRIWEQGISTVLRSTRRCGEMADALDSKSGSRKGVGVRVPPPAPIQSRIPNPRILPPARFPTVTVSVVSRRLSRSASEFLPRTALVRSPIQTP